MPMTLVVDSVMWRLQQRILLRIHTGFPLGSALPTISLDATKLLNFVRIGKNRPLIIFDTKG